MSGFGLADPAMRSRGWLLLVFLTILLVVIIGSQSFMLIRVTNSLEEELGLRLLTVATAAVSAATPGLLLDPNVNEYEDYFHEVLDPLRNESDLTDLLLVDRDGFVLFDLDDGPLGEVHAFLELDWEAFLRAVEGEPSASHLVRADRAMMKAAFVPVLEWEGGPVGAVLCVTAGGDFHERLPALQRTSWAISIGSAALIVLLSVLLFRVLRQFSVTDTALARAEALSAMGMMAAGVAHEIRNPLTIIAGTAVRLRRKYGATSDGDDDELFDYIPEEVERLNGILEGYLRFARDERVSPVDCDLAQLVRRCGGMVSDEFAKGGVDVDVTGTEEAVPLRADPQRLQQVLLNLLLNSAQAMSSGGTISMSLSSAGSRAIVRVADTGPGFGEKALRGALQPFFTTKEQGSGLGLAVARRIIEVHGGTISLANREGGGAVVTIELPRRESDPGATTMDGKSRASE